MADVTVEFGATDTGLEKTLKAVQGELNSLKEKVKGGELSMTELESTMKRIGQVTSMEKNIKAIGEQSKGTAGQVKTLGEAAEDTGKKAELGFGKIAAGASIAGAAAKLGSMAIDAAFAAAQKTVQSFGDALNMGGRLADLSDRTGVAVDKLLILERAFQNTGVGADSLGPIINKMQKAIVDAGDGSSKAADAFTKLGIPLSTLQKLSPDEQLQAIGKAIASIPDPAERAAISMEIFGKSGGALNQVFANMDGEVATAKAQLGSLPDVMKAGAAQFDKISDNLTVIGGKFVEFAAGIIDKVKPALDALTTAMTRIDATKIGQEFAGFFTGVGDGMKGFQAAVNAIDAGDLSTGFKIAAQAIQIQFIETGNSIYQHMVAAFKTAGDFIMEQFGASGPIVALFSNVAQLIGGNIKDSLFTTLAEIAEQFGMIDIATGFRLSAENGAEQVKYAMEEIPKNAKLVAEKAGESMGNIPNNFKANMEEIPPLFTGIEDHQAEIDRLTQSITKSQNDQTAAVSETAKEQAVAEQEARKYFDEYQKGQAKATEKAKELADKEAEKQAKLEETLRLKREEVNAQIDINNAIASGNTKEAESLRGAESIKRTIEDLKKTGFGEDEAAKMANEMARAAREADRMQKSLATKIGEDIKNRQESEAIDPSGKLMKQAQDQISAGKYREAEFTAQKLRANEQESMIRGVGAGKDIRAIRDIARDYGLDQMKSEQELKKELYKIRTEGDITESKLEKGAEAAQKGLGKGMEKEQQKKTEEKKGGLSLEKMVEAIQKAVEKIEPKLPQQVLV